MCHQVHPAAPPRSDISDSFSFYSSNKFPVEETSKSCALQKTCSSNEMESDLDAAGSIEMKNVLVQLHFLASTSLYIMHIGPYDSRHERVREPPFGTRNPLRTNFTVSHITYITYITPTNIKQSKTNFRHVHNTKLYYSR